MGKTRYTRAMETVDYLVIGAGVVGLAIARELSLKNKEVIVIDRERMAGSITSARNSGVIHAGIYYPEGSNKARFCVAGKEMLYAYAKQHAIPHKNCGKLIVATTETELARLDAIMARATANGVHDLVRLSADDVLTKEPTLNAVGGLFSPSTGIIDIHVLMESMQADISNHGGLVALSNGFARGEITEAGMVVHTISGESILARNVVNAAGIAAQSVAHAMDGMPQETIPKLHLAKGNYFSISGKTPFSHLVYPVPEPGGLGAHFTMNMAGESLFGPDVEWLDETTNATNPAALNYNVDASRMETFYTSIRRYWPGIDAHNLQPAYAGIRPKLAAKGDPDGDFTIHTHAHHGVQGLVHLYGIESPGLTASMAIAQEVVDLI